jgi:SnoaL-like domain
VAANLSETLAVLDLLGRYNEVMDHRRESGIRDVFVQDGRLEFPGAVKAGHESIIRWMHRAPSGVHVNGSPVVRVDGDQVTNTCSYLFHDTDANIVLTGYYNDTIVIADGLARFVVRNATISRPI